MSRSAVSSPPSSVRRRGAVVLTALAVFLLAFSSPGYADPEEDELSLDELNERAQALEEEYNAELVQYTSAKEEAEKIDPGLAANQLIFPDEETQKRLFPLGDFTPEEERQATVRMQEITGAG